MSKEHSIITRLEKHALTDMGQEQAFSPETYPLEFADKRIIRPVTGLMDITHFPYDIKGVRLLKANELPGPSGKDSS